MTPQFNVADYVDGERLWRSILDMAKIGATPNGGSSRIAFSREDDEGRLLFKSWCEEAGLLVENDAFGNMYALRKGRLDTEPVLIGSHLDTQPKGGRFDGVLGVLGGLEVVRALNDAGIETERPIVLANWTNEEGAVLTPMMGSAVFAGTLALTDALECILPDGRTVRIALSSMACGSGKAAPGFPMSAYLELHIEQGPVLEGAGIEIGVVTGGIAFRRLGVRIEGEGAHAGPTPMSARKDPVAAAARAIIVADDFARRLPHARSTVGTMRVSGGSPNTVAEQVEFTLDLRHADSDKVEEMERAFREALQAAADASGVRSFVEVLADSPPAPFSKDIVAAVEENARSLGLSRMQMPSGAGHDACNISRRYPTGMIFVQSVGGLSHNEAEFTPQSDCTAGVRVLAMTATSLASGGK